MLDADITESAKRVARALEAANVPYAIGGAIALTMHGFVRATRDVDVNAFCVPTDVPGVIDALVKAGLQLEPERALAEASSEGWFTAWDGPIRVDVFVPSIAFSWEARDTRVELEFLGHRTWFLSAEALCVFKLLFFRNKDLADLEQLVMGSRTLDRAAVRAKIVALMGEDDERVRSWDEIVARYGASA